MSLTCPLTHKKTHDLHRPCATTIKNHNHFYAAKVRINEQNAKGKLVFLFILE